MTLLEKTIGYVFHSQVLLRTALTHPSRSGEEDTANNQRLEFLGDAVLQLVMSERLYSIYPNQMEGALSRLRSLSVQESALCDAARKIHLGASLYMGHGESLSGGRDRPSILADAMEALLGAVYLDGGLTSAQELALRLLPIAPEQVARDYKTALQEQTQAGGGCAPMYRLVSEEGPAHNRVFMTEVWLNDRLIGYGQGTSKKAAEQDAARDALEKTN